MDNRASKSEGIDKKTSITCEPLVSIITPVFNGVKYLEACIQSVLNQTYPYIEHVIVDGGSTDGTVEILSTYQAKSPDRIRFISEPDRGAGDAWNKGLRMARGEIFGWLGADDTYEPDAIHVVVEFFRSNPNAYFVFGSCNYINEKGNIIRRCQTKDFDLEEIINYSNYVPCTSLFYKQEAVEKVGWLDTKGNDLDFLIRAGKIFQIHRIEKVISNFRIHEGSATTGSSKEMRRMWLREDCFVSRQHGGRFFSGYCRRYYRFVIIEQLRPILGTVYPLIQKLLRR